jgi:hypothetical protein
MAILFATAAKRRLARKLMAPASFRREPPEEIDQRLVVDLCLGLVTPWKQIGGEIRSWASWTVRAQRRWAKIGIGYDHLPIKMPGSMSEPRDNDCKADEERQRSGNQQQGNDKSPRCGGNGIAGHRS